MYRVSCQEYGRPLSTIFVDTGCPLYDEENDPTVSFLRYIDYKYLRFFYHQVDDRFCLISGWKDPLWTNAKMMRAGLDADDRDSREQVFGKNLIDIHQKSAFELLLDEVSLSFAVPSSKMISNGTRPFIHFTSFKSQVLCYGHWINTTIMLPVYLQYPFSA